MPIAARPPAALRDGVVPLALAALAALALSLAACTGGSGGGGGAGSSGGAAPGASTGTGTQAPGGPSQQAQLAAIVADEQARRRRYLEDAALGMPGHGETLYAQLSRLALGLPIADRAPLDQLLDKVDQRPDTADFSLTALLRFVFLHGSDPLLPQDLRDRAKRSILGFKYWIDEPGQDEMVYWSENHQIMFHAGAYLAGQLYPAETFTNSGLTGAALAQKARPRMMRWLEHRWLFGFSEWCSPVYYPHDVAPLLNLVDFAGEPDVSTRAAMVLDLLLFDLARLSNRGSFGVTAGRVYVEHKLSGRRQSIGDLAEVLFGERGFWQGRGSTAGTPYVTSPRYRVPHALLAIGKDKPARFVDRSRTSIDLAEGPGFGIGFSSLDDGMVWWGMGAYTAPETIVASKHMLETWGLWRYGSFGFLSPIRSVPDALLPAISSTLSPLSEGSVLSQASLYTYRSPDAMLSSVQDYRKGQVGFQQHSWQATLDLDAVVFTTQPGNLGQDGPDYWTGTGSHPRVVQHERALVALYNPGLAQRALFPAVTHAWFPRAGFDEVVERAPWTFGRKGSGYVALFSAQPVTWQQQGPYAGQELLAPGFRNIWICQIGRAAEDGSFQDFQDRIARALVRTIGAGAGAQDDLLEVVYDAPGVGVFEVRWQGAPLVNGQPHATRGFLRFDNPYVRQPFGARYLELRHLGAALVHDWVAGTRSGTGL